MSTKGNVPNTLGTDIKRVKSEHDLAQELEVWQVAGHRV